MSTVTLSGQRCAPMVAHVIHRLAVGGLENGLVNLINFMPSERYDHAIICLTDSTEFRDRIHRKDVPIIALHKREGQDVGIHLRLWSLFRRLRPTVVHTRNVASLEYVLPAVLAGIPGRVHGEHGRDMSDLDGLNWKYNALRKMVKPAITQYTTVSVDLANWLIETVGVSSDRVRQIYNGVDTQRFYPRVESRRSIGPPEFAPPGTFVIGTVGRMNEVKDQLTLVRAFVRMIEADHPSRRHLRLVLIGDGPLRAESLRLLREADGERLAWLPGERSDIPELMQGFDLFVLPSLREGISNTILEAMASGLPVVATRVGGNPELVDEGLTGTLVPPADPESIAKAIGGYLAEPRRLGLHGEEGRRKVEKRFSMEAMVSAYLDVYDTVLNRRRASA